MQKPKIIRTIRPPEYRLVPETENSHIMGGAKWLLKPIDLEKYGYIEEEYIVKGYSNVYDWEDDEKYPHVIFTDAPYCSRIVVRKPKDPSKFSGIVHCELCNPNSGYDRSNTGWAPSNEYIMSRGHGSVSMTISEIAMKGLRRFDPERYGELAFKNPIRPEDRMPAVMGLGGRMPDEETEDGLKWDYISQVGALVKSGLPGSPFDGYGVKKIMLQGTTGGDLSAYAAAIHPLVRLGGGEHVYDGFLVFMTGAPGGLNNYRAMLHELDPRDLYTCEVPLIHLLTLGDLLGDTIHPSWSTLWHRYQPNEEGRYLRIIEIAGAGISRRYASAYSCCNEDVEKAGAKQLVGAGEMQAEYPAHYVVCAMIENLIEWMTTGKAPEICDYVETEGEYPNLRFKKDRFGNAMGGLRSPYVDCPLYVYTPAGGTERRLTDDEIRSLYSSREDYVKKVTASVNKMLEKRYILPEHAEMVIKEAEEAELPF